MPSSASPQLDHCRPRTNGRRFFAQNVILACARCNGHVFTEFEFTKFLVSLLSTHPGFSEVEQEPLLEGAERFRPDILVRQRLPSNRKLIIECRLAVASGVEHIAGIVELFERYAEYAPDARPVLAIPASLSEYQKAVLHDAQIECWDLPALADIFSETIPLLEPGFYSNLIAHYLAKNKVPSREEVLIARLAECRPGKQDWQLYQKLVGEILEHLFCPDLNKSISERFDKLKVNRRDVILPNYADSGFWASLRAMYKADYIVVDAKNYNELVEKDDVLQVANYLKSYGTGLFGLICTRKGGDKNGCESTLREQWSAHQKFILVLNDEDLIEMLTAKLEQRRPEDTLAAKIEDFRLSM